MSNEELVTIELTGLTAAEVDMVNAVIHEGELRERERIIAILKANGYDSGHLIALIEGEQE